MSIKSIGNDWKRSIRTGALADRDLRLYCDFRQLEYPDLGTGSAQYTVAREDQLIDRGNCELPIAPMIFGETVPVFTGVTSWALSTDFAHTGDSSYKHVRSDAGVSAARFNDSASTTDMHEYVAGSTYTITFWSYVPTTSGASASEC